MSIRATTALLLLALAPLAMASKSNIAAKETFNIDSVHSTAIFRVQHLGAGNSMAASMNSRAPSTGMLRMAHPLT